MVLHESGSSTNTLVSLPPGKALEEEEASPQEDLPQEERCGAAAAFRRTRLYLSPPDAPDGGHDDGDSWYSCGGTEASEEDAVHDAAPRPLHLPLHAAVDECLPRILLDARDALLLAEPARYTAQSRERLLYVGQGEIAHAVPLQCDVLVSDRATTCHLLAVRSESALSGKPPLSSLAHLDGPRYADCLRDLFRRHARHHGPHGGARVAIHVLGGFRDDCGASRALAQWLLHHLADAAEEHADRLTVTLQTCAIGGLNDNGRGAPRGRGLALSTKTGRVSLAHCRECATGPCRSLRSARLFGGEAPTRLACVHSEAANGLTIEPFVYQLPEADLAALLALPDEALLRVASTSPHCEGADFCAALRATLRWVRDVPAEGVFRGPENRIVLRRVGGGGNRWRSLCGRFAG